MSIRLSTLLYSDYSLHSNRLLKLIQDATSVDFQALINLKLINIDNKKVRQQIKDSKIIQVKSVPCVLVVYMDGGVSKFEGNEAFEWIEGIIQTASPVIQQPPPSPLPITQPTIQLTPQPAIQHTKQSSELVQSTEKETVDIPQSTTTIESLGEEPVDIETPVPIQRPKAGLITGTGGYEIQEFGEEIQVERTTTKGINKDKGSKKDVVSMAQAMQKAREAEFEKNKPRGLP